jgi:subtilase family serine protease
MSPLQFVACAQNLAVPSGHDTALNLANNLAAGDFSRGQWHHVELVLVANTAATAAADGQVQWWLDGQPVGTASNIPWVGPGETDTWETFAWTPVWGGAGGTVPADQYMWMDQYYASGK